MSTGLRNRSSVSTPDVCFSKISSFRVKIVKTLNPFLQSVEKITNDIICFCNLDKKGFVNRSLNKLPKWYQPETKLWSRHQTVIRALWLVPKSHWCILPSVHIPTESGFFYLKHPSTKVDPTINSPLFDRSVIAEHTFISIGYLDIGLHDHRERGWRMLWKQCAAQDAQSSSLAIDHCVQHTVQLDNRSFHWK